MLAPPSSLFELQATFTMVTMENSTLHSPSLPVELFAEIINFLPPTDQRTLTLVSRLTRKLALESVFGQLRFTGKITPKIRDIHQARDDVKEVIKKLDLYSDKLSIQTDDDSDVLFRFLETLPNLNSLKYRQHGLLIRPRDFSKLITSLRRAPLLEFSIDTGNYGTVEGLPPAGPPFLKRLYITWYLSDDPNVPDSSSAHLGELIRPSLATLVELKIENQRAKLGADLDLQLLRPAGNTLQIFDYTLRNHDDTILNIIPEIFPRLVKLSIKWSNRPMGHSILWEDSHINALSKNKNLTDLTLSSDFEVAVNDIARSDEDYPFFVRCYKRRLTATQRVVCACTNLLRCNWLQMRVGRHHSSSMVHPFVIEERVVDGKAMRTVRGVKQFWMGRDQEFWVTGEIVKCKLEDLPGDIIGENDPDEEL